MILPMSKASPIGEMATPAAVAKSERLTFDARCSGGTGVDCCAAANARSMPMTVPSRPHNGLMASTDPITTSDIGPFLDFISSLFAHRTLRSGALSSVAWNAWFGIPLFQIYFFSLEQPGRSVQQMIVQPFHYHRPYLLRPDTLRVVDKAMAGTRAGQEPHRATILYQCIGKDQRLVIRNRRILRIMH